MKFNKWIVLFLLCLFGFNSNAQDYSFPVTGTYDLQDPADSRPKDFNKVKIETNTFSLWMDGQLVRSYQIVEPIKGGFAVEQIVAGNGWKEKFNVTINEINNGECFFTVHYEEGSEAIHLQKVQ